jgi:PAS domain S-box-containing protein
MLRESEEMLRVIFEGALDGILLVNAETRQFVNGNPEICRMLGYSPAELIRVHAADIHPPQDLPWITGQIELHLQGKTRLSEDIPVRHRDGSVFYADIKSAPVALGGKTHIVAIFRDITERRKTEEMRRISALKHQLLFDSSIDALMTLAPPEWKFTGANAATLKLFCVSSVAEFTAFSPCDLSPLRQPDGSLSGDKVQEMIETAMRCGSHFFEWEHLRLDGSPFAASVLLTRMSLGDELFIQATVRDITEHKLRVLELKEYQELLRALAAQGSVSREAELKHIAREVHDELGQLLTALRMDLSLLRIRFGEHDSSLMTRIQGMLVLVDKAIKGVRNVTANLRPPALDVGIAAAIQWLGDQFNARATASCSVYILDDPAGLDDASTLTLFRIVQESLTNISRHAQADFVEIRLGQSGDDICVEVTDDGKGFDPATMSAKISFGLMGMKERAMAVGGRVEITSAPMQGTLVSVYIPLLPGKERS